MKLNKFIKTLESNPNIELLFEYAPDKFARANYHLTEVKNVKFDTTDCGGKTNYWEETHFQIWESPNEIGKMEFMKTDKILSILKKVDGIKSLLLDTELKIEYGNENFPTSVMPIEDIQIDEDKLIVSLFVEATRCKANDVCGITVDTKETSCCVTTECC